MADMTAEQLAVYRAWASGAPKSCATPAQENEVQRGLLRALETAEAKIATLNARLSGMAAVPEGWKLVPVNATDEMLEAWHTGSLSAVPDGDWRGRPTISANAMYRSGYAAMLDAAPEVPGHG